MSFNRKNNRDLCLPYRFSKGHEKQLVEIEPVRVMIRPHPYADLGLVNIFEEGAQETIPEGKYGAIIGIPLFDDHGVVYPMHGRGDK